MRSISRRSALVVGPLALGTLLLGANRAYANENSLTTLPLNTIETTAAGVRMAATSVPQICFDTEFSQAMPWLQTLSLNFSGSTSRIVGTKLSMSFDNRTSQWTGSPAIWRQDSDLIELQTRMAPSNSSQDVLEITFPEKIADVTGDSSAFQLYIPLAAGALYPNENIGPVTPSLVKVENIPGLEISVIPTTPVQTGLAWGAEVSAIWDRVDIKGLGYSVPQVIRVQSVGPGPIPSGSLLNISADNAIVTSLDFRSITLSSTGANFSVSQLDNAQNLANSVHKTLVFDQVVQPGISVMIAVDSKASTATPTSRDLSFSTVEFIGNGDKVFARQTDRYAISRVTSSGRSQLSNSLIS